MSTELREEAVAVEGAVLHCRVAGRGPLVLCLHGFPDTAHSFDALLPELAAAGFTAVAPFLRGYAPSSLATDDDYSMSAVAGDIFALMDAFGAEDAALIGHDWGGFAAYTAANWRPERVRRVAVLAVPHLAAPRMSWAQLRRSWYVWLFQLPWLPERLVARDDFRFIDRLYRQWSPSWPPGEYDLRPVKDALAAPGGLRAALAYYRAMIRGSSAALRRLMSQPTSVPSLWLVGSEDGSVGVEQFADMERAFTGPFRKHVIPAGHFLHREQPALCQRLLLEFLRS